MAGDCVIDLCTHAGIVCTEETTKQCDATTQQFGQKNAGFVNPREPRQTCQDPVKEINWCQLSTTPNCQAMAMVHELAHACGWPEGAAGPESVCARRKRGALATAAAPPSRRKKERRYMEERVEPAWLTQPTSDEGN